MKCINHITLLSPAHPYLPKLLITIFGHTPYLPQVDTMFLGHPTFFIVALLKQIWYFNEQKKYANVTELMSNSKSRFECEVDDAKPEPADTDLRMSLYFSLVVSCRWLFAARGPIPP